MNRTIFFQFVRYNMVGIANTLVGFSIIFLLMFSGVDPTISNIIGYAIVSILSYYLNKTYTFESSKNSKIEAIKFFVVLGISYLLNFITLQWLLGFINPYYAQIVSAVVYTLSSFILVKLLVFRKV